MMGSSNGEHGNLCGGFDYSESEKWCALHTGIEGASDYAIVKERDYKHYSRINVKGAMSEGSIEVVDLVLEHGHVYYLNVRARNKLGYVTVASSPGVMVDLTPPSVGNLTIPTITKKADRCSAAPTQRCMEVTSGVNHWKILDGDCSKAIFNHDTVRQDTIYTGVSVALKSHWVTSLTKRRACFRFYLPTGKACARWMESQTHPQTGKRAKQTKESG